MSSVRKSVGIVMRTLDRPLFVRRALRSVQAQTFANWTIQLINDGGNAATLEATVAEVGAETPFAEGRLQITHVPSSIGRSAAFNRGLAQLDTDFVTCLDDDDTWDPEFLQSLVEFFEATAEVTPELGGVLSGVTAIREDVIDVDGVQSIMVLGEDGLPNAYRRDDFFINPISYACYRQDMVPVQWMLRREAAQSVGGFPEEFNVMEDRAFMARFLRRWRMAKLNRKLAYHHRRVRRTEDTRRSIDMNSMDNPSYDWRLFADLARVPIHTPPTATKTLTQLSDLMHGIAGTVLKELNDETSALWHKVDSEVAALRARLAALETRLSARPEEVVPGYEGEDVAWSLWEAVSEGDVGYPIRAGDKFADRLHLSQPFDVPGQLMHASPVTRRLSVQLPQTRDFSAIEVSLDGLNGQSGVKCHLDIAVPGGFLFETALSVFERDVLGRRKHAFVERHVHACPAGDRVRLVRVFDASWMQRSPAAKLSIILPCHATNLQVVIHDLVVSRA